MHYTRDLSPIQCNIKPKTYLSTLGYHHTVFMFFSLTGGTFEISRTSSRVIVPIFDRLCCCLPAALRTSLRCGVPLQNPTDEANGNDVGRKMIFRSDVVANDFNPDMAEEMTRLKESHP